MRSKTSIFLYVIIGLAVIGLFSQLFTNTTNFMKSIFIMIGVGLVMYAVVYFLFIRNRPGSSEMAKYKKAVKQSKSKYKQNKPMTQRLMQNKNKTTTPVRRRLNRRAPHLRVIEGNKSKRNNRANF